MQFELWPNGATESEGVLITTEEWRTIPGFLRYEVSNMGRFRNKATGTFLNPSPLHDGYLKIGLTKNGKQYALLAHRIVAQTFLEADSPTHCQVNHKNKHRSDNRLSNLEWLTRSQNAKHAWSIPRPDGDDTGPVRLPKSSVRAKNLLMDRMGLN